MHNLHDLGLHSFVTVAVNPVQFVTTTEEKPLQRQFLPPNDGVGLLHSLMCDTVTSPHDPLFLGHDGNYYYVSAHASSYTGMIVFVNKI